ncbi:EpsG family protein [Pseudomonas lurida]|uniref:EpsG family protein n=1 Tax=Pseudomonas lurida TaxID=244566 RepID=UPI0016469A96|nr:EpsG family protein [Pseudomonas lurida]MBC3247350.1 EpsG family protein [Pseudomonas lurida]
MFLYYFPFFVSFFYSAFRRPGRIAYFFLTCLLIAMCALQAPGVSEDHLNYVNYVTDISDGTQGVFFIEPTFYILSKLSLFLTGGDFFMFLVYAILGVAIKLYLSKRVSEYYWFSAAIYTSYFFFLQDFTQIRIGVAMSFILLSAFRFYEGKCLSAAVFFVCAVCFHYSTVFFLPFYFLLCFNSARCAMALYMLCCAFLLLFMLDVSIAQGLLSVASSMSIERLSFYIENAFAGEGGEINLVRVLFHFILLTPPILFFDRIKKQSNFVSYAVIVHLCGLIILLLLHDLQVFAYRISDIFNGFIIFSLLSYIIIFGRLVGGALILSVSLFQLVYVLVILGFVNPYTSVLGVL